MKPWMITSFVSVATFAAGCTVVICIRTTHDFLEQANLSNVRTVPVIELDEIKAPPLYLESPPIFDPNLDYTRSLKIKLLQTGEFHSEEVPYRSGERWLGLFRIGERYVLRPTTIWVRHVDDDGLMDTEVSTSNPNSSVYLLRGDSGLQPGEIETVFDLTRGDDFDLVGRNSFGRRGQFWRLWIDNAAPEGYPQKGSALILQESGGAPWTLRSIPEGCDDCGWQVLWVGDLDRDGKLDFLIDVSGHYNSYEPTLFLSSRGYSVFASFRGVGC